MGERQNEAAGLCRGLVLSVQQLLVTLTEWGCFLFRKGSQCVDVYTHHCVCEEGRRTKHVLHTRVAAEGERDEERLVASAFIIPWC